MFRHFRTYSRRQRTLVSSGIQTLETKQGGYFNVMLPQKTIHTIKTCCYQRTAHPTMDNSQLLLINLCNNAVTLQHKSRWSQCGRRTRTRKQTMTRTILGWQSLPFKPLFCAIMSYRNVKKNKNQGYATSRAKQHTTHLCFVQALPRLFPATQQRYRAQIAVMIVPVAQS